MDYERLWNLIKMPPFSALDDAGCAAACNAKTVEKRRPITSGELLSWLGQQGRFQRLEAAAANENLDAEIRSVAKVALKLIQREDTSVDLTRDEHAGMLHSLVDAGVATPQEATELYALATYKLSPAEAEGLPVVRLGHVHDARKKFGGA